MVWNILRRTTLILLLAGVPFYIPVQVFSAPLDSKHRTQHQDIYYSPPFLTPQQSHMAAKAWSIDLGEAVESRPDIAFWIDKWSSPEGLQKLSIAESRAFDYRLPVNSVIRESRLPWELAAIPVVESNWRIDAVSSSGAAGPWQFMESSGRGRNLVIDVWRDDRRDFWRSTEAAMQELAFYYRLYSDWMLAVASYNAGPTRIGRIRKESGLESYWDLLDAGILPPETRNYVPQIIAVAYLINHRGRSGLPMNWETPIRWSRIPLSRSIHLEKLSEATGIDRELIRLANRELHHPVTPPPSLPYFIKIPEEYAEKTIEWLQNNDTGDAPERFWRYTVHSGDTLSEIAGKSGISLSELLSYNSHVRDGVLRIGERLYLPGNITVPEGAESDDLPDWKGRYHVQIGDTFWSIAIRFGVKPERLAEANHRSLNGVLLAGSVLRVPEEGEEK